MLGSQTVRTVVTYMIRRFAINGSSRKHFGFPVHRCRAGDRLQITSQVSHV